MKLQFSFVTHSLTFWVSMHKWICAHLSYLSFVCETTRDGWVLCNCHCSKSPIGINEIRYVCCMTVRDFGCKENYHHFLYISQIYYAPWSSVVLCFVVAMFWVPYGLVWFIEDVGLCTFSTCIMVCCVVYITVTSHERQGIWNQRKRNCLFNNFPLLTHYKEKYQSTDCRERFHLMTSLCQKSLSC